MNDFGARLKEERQTMGLSQQRFAAIGGVEANAQGKYENGQRMPRSNYLVALSERGVDVHYLLSGSRLPVCMDSLSVVERDIILQFRLLSDMAQNAIRQLALSLRKHFD
ncbi:MULTISPECIES: helix-turn-helix domain-containing protein [Pseudomonas]|uniref:Helix-turn-helix domain-containing protein n=3 Tax=Pseudomonas TaxID=286 RepID=A0ABX6HES0_9PSED|nr:MULTISPECIES: helix-turn-helix transcriptional regulator [Pseudomonas]MBC3954103.1 helix-turn-helix transcriptional regulator [Pseudomonas triticifolii]QHF03829.1 helix-turn-helix domain-containing protein [Pseudomonas asturiensis]